MYEAFFRSLRSTVRLHGEGGSAMVETVPIMPMETEETASVPTPPRRRPLIKRIIMRILRPFVVPAINRFHYYVQHAVDHGQLSRNVSALDLRIADLDVKLVRLANTSSGSVRDCFSDMHEDVLGLTTRVDEVSLRLDRIDARFEEALTGFGRRDPSDRPRSLLFRTEPGVATPGPTEKMPNREKTSSTERR